MFKSVKILRLGPGQEFLTELHNYCERKNISSAVILGVIGSFEAVELGTARKDGAFGQDHDKYTGHLSVISGQGSLCLHEGKRAFHIHMVLVDPEKPGQLIGGHVHGATVWSTVEIYIGELDYQLYREIDPVVGRPVLRTPED